MAQQWSGAPSERERPIVYNGNKLLKLAGVLWLGLSIVLLLGVWTNGMGELGKVWGSLLFTLSMTFTSFLQAWRWARINPRRQAAARGDTILASLAVEQPAPRETALPLPHTITMKPRKLQDALVGMALAVGVLLAYLVYQSITGDTSQWVAVLILAGVFVVFGLLAPLFPASRISVTRYALKVRRQPRGGEVLWRDARLLAIRGGKAGTPATRYELASERATVEWRRLRRIRWFSVEQPELLFEEYDREMDALLAVIAAKTGLQLYDLR